MRKCIGTIDDIMANMRQFRDGRAPVLALETKTNSVVLGDRFVSFRLSDLDRASHMRAYLGTGAYYELYIRTSSGEIYKIKENTTTRNFVIEDMNGKVAADIGREGLVRPADDTIRIGDVVAIRGPNGIIVTSPITEITAVAGNGIEARSVEVISSLLRGNLRREVSTVIDEFDASLREARRD